MIRNAKGLMGIECGFKKKIVGLFGFLLLIKTINKLTKSIEIKVFIWNYLVLRKLNLPKVLPFEFPTT